VRFSYYNRLSARQQAVYRASDAVEALRLPPGAALDLMVRQVADALAAGDQPRTQAACQALIDALAARFKVPRIQVVVAARRPALRGGGDLMGLYEPQEGGRPIRISVWMRTAQRSQVVAFRTFLRTLLHEFCHHLDYELLGLVESFHTAGFYKRESSLMNQLLPRQGDRDP
jgi:hypothetical protein